MNWLRRIFGKTPALAAGQQHALAAYQALPAIASTTPIAALQFIVADVETTGLHPYSDRLISIGAVPLQQGKICLGQGFEVIFRQPRASATANILIHGIDGTTQRGGLPHADAMLRFLGYAGKAPLVGFHAGFDRVMINRAAQAALGENPSNTWLDLAYLTPTVFGESGARPELSLDEWLQRLDIRNYARHNALADALATAQLLQIVLARAAAGGAATLHDLMSLEQDQRWLRQL